MFDPMIRLTVRALAGAALLLAAPSAAHAAPVLNPLKPCYWSADLDPATGKADTQNVIVGGSGFTPNSLVTITRDGATVASNVQVDGAGVLTPGAVPAPYQEEGERAFTIAVTEQANVDQTVSASALVVDADFTVRPKRARPSQRVTFSGRGFTTPGPVFAHYVRRGKVRETVRLARTTSGPCGTFSVRRRQFPFRRPRLGTWLLQVDQHRRWSRRPQGLFMTREFFVAAALPTR